VEPVYKKKLSKANTSFFWV